MAFLGVMKDLLETGRSPVIQEKDKIQSIVDLMDNVRIRNNPMIVAVMHSCSAYKKINFGETGIIDVRNLYNAFNVTDTSEVIVANIGSKDGVFGKYEIQILLTDRALYYTLELAKRTGKESSNRIDLSDFSKYVLLVSDNIVQFVNENESVTIYQKSAISSQIFSDLAAQELGMLIRVIQKALCQTVEYASKDRKKLYHWISEMAKENLLKPEREWEFRTELLISSMREDEEYTLECDLLLLRYCLYDNDYLKFHNILTMITASDLETVQKYRWKFDKLVCQYMADLGKESIEFPMKYGHKVSMSDKYLLPLEWDTGLSRAAQEIFDIFQLYTPLIVSYLAVRSNPYLNISNMNDVLKDKGLSNEEREEVLKFAMQRRNKGMLEVCRNLKNGGELYEACLSRIDGFGLTPLHYSLILRNDRAIQYALKHISKLADAEQDISHSSGKYYSYIVLACLTGQTKYAWFLLESFDEIKMLESEKRKILIKMKMSETAGVFMSHAALAAERQLRYDSEEEIDNDTMWEQRERVDEAKGYSADMRQQAGEYEKEIEDKETEIKMAKEYLMQEHKKMVELLARQATQLDKLFFQLFTNSENLERALTVSSKDCCVLAMDEKFLVLMAYNIISKDR